MMDIKYISASPKQIENVTKKEMGYWSRKPRRLKESSVFKPLQQTTANWISCYGTTEKRTNRHQYNEAKRRKAKYKVKDVPLQSMHDWRGIWVIIHPAWQPKMPEGTGTAKICQCKSQPVGRELYRLSVYLPRFTRQNQNRWPSEHKDKHQSANILLSALSSSNNTPNVINVQPGI